MPTNTNLHHDKTLSMWKLIYVIPLNKEGTVRFVGMLPEKGHPPTHVMQVANVGETFVIPEGVGTNPRKPQKSKQLIGKTAKVVRINLDTKTEDYNHEVYDVEVEIID